MNTDHAKMPGTRDKLTVVTSPADFPLGPGLTNDPFFGGQKPRYKTRFLVFKHNKYLTVSTGNIAYFYVKYNSSVIVCFDRQEYFVNYSLEKIHSLVSGDQFFRLNRQYLINFHSIKEVEHYFARKLLVNLIVPVSEKLLVTKEKTSAFLNWLDNR